MHQGRSKNLANPGYSRHPLGSAARSTSNEIARLRRLPTPSDPFRLAAVPFGSRMPEVGILSPRQDQTHLFVACRRDSQRLPVKGLFRDCLDVTLTPVAG